MDEPVVRTFRHGPLWNFSYLLAMPGGEAIAIDPGGEVADLVDAALSLDARITAALLTHGHHDHSGGLRRLVEATGATAFANGADAATIVRETGVDVAQVGHGHEFSLGGLTLALLHTPGHTPGSLCLLAGDWLFTGDTLMTSGRGRHALVPGAAEQLDRSLADVLGALPGHLTVYPGHDEGPERTATLETALSRGQGNPFAKC